MPVAERMNHILRKRIFGLGKFVIKSGQENHDEGAKRPNGGLAPWMN